MTTTKTSPSTASLSVVVLNYNSFELTIDLLRSLAEHELVDWMSVIVVDNNSPNDSYQEIKNAVASNRWDAWCRIVKSEQNGGFSAGNNLALVETTSTHVILLNSDTLVEAPSLTRLSQIADEQPDAAIFSPRLQWADGTAQNSCFRFFRPLTELVNAAGSGPITRLFPAATVPWETDGQGGHLACEPDWVSFACVLIRREVIEQIGLMDDDFFMYYEDIDFCRRARNAGYLIRHVPDTKVVHLRGGSSPVKSLQTQRKRRPRYYYAARARYYAKHFGRFGLFRANCFWLLGRGIAFCREAGGRRPPHACEAEWKDIWINFWNPLTGRHR
ncbi:glycosyltransferase family 2 protein [Allorhodopirellula heiligendammensis]|uniref:N-acetylglucosaminyl-diphospho-decaprenol L-rhamnosyltransferase n=1 Tax=Allorhodopirellula heiligendammensis TaxID=2714739 RepID=A0A5C6C443_9BACT|nr:glycosyltransferase family 2 protein [Allorhodopirellula heiligendammensis]TWU18074.1 N-acetylglucosaminyl-diphospho-decaprenol L-rhamnosyltransferase [Allorhodopirellula heiligendammensis]